MSREYFIHDALGERRIGAGELPLGVGGKSQGGIVLSGAPEHQLYAYIALENGHAYIQPVADETKTAAVFLNDERLNGSAWLKSGDRVQIENHLLSWTVRGDKVLIELSRPPGDRTLQPPVQNPPSDSLPANNEMPVQAHEPPEQDSKKRFMLIAYSLVGLLLLAAAYLMMAIPITLRIEPQAGHININGFPPPLKLWGAHLALPGQYTIEASHEGYLPLNESIDIRRDGATDLVYKLEERPGRLAISTRPDVEFQLEVNGKKINHDKHGLTQIKRGAHEIRLETERYLPHEQTIEIEGYGRERSLRVDLQPAWAEVTMFSTPEHADVELDGKQIGQTPLNAEILQGQHEFKLSLMGFKPVAIKHVIKAGEKITLETFQLQPVDGELSINSQPPGASITLDGVFKGTTPITLKLVANLEHRLQISKAGYSPISQSMRLDPDQQRTLELKLEPEYGTLFLSTHPVDARLLIDGKPTQLNSGRLRLSVRPHTLTLSRTGYVTHQQSITPKRGVSLNLDIKLQRAQAASPEQPVTSIPDLITSPTGQTLQLIKPESTLRMGASRREAGRRSNENRRTVQFKRPFYFAHKETSNQDYRQFSAKHNSGSLDGAGLNTDAQPVVNVSWEDAARYCNWLSGQQGLPEAYRQENGRVTAVHPMNTGYRLPSEAEWAWVSRRRGQANEQRYPWTGNYPPTQLSGNYADAQIADTLADTVPAYDDGFRGTAPVASFPAWPERFFDLGGNASEWVNDYYTLYPGVGAKTVIDPLGPPTGTHHSVRGAGWRHGNITELRLSYRDYSNKPRYDLGFRIARYAE